LCRYNFLSDSIRILDYNNGTVVAVLLKSKFAGVQDVTYNGTKVIAYAVAKIMIWDIGLPLNISITIVPPLLVITLQVDIPYNFQTSLHCDEERYFGNI
jgi:hypothetical protein